MTRKLLLFAFAAVTSTSLAGLSPTQGLMRLAQTSERVPPFVAGEVLVKFQRGAAASYRQDALKSIRGQVKETVRTRAMEALGDDEGILLVKTSERVTDAIEELMTLPGVDYAEPNYIWRTADFSTDPDYVNGNLWGMYSERTTPANPYGSQVAELWNQNRVGKTTTHVGIIDEGVMISHYELQPNIWVNPFDPIDGIDNDGNGYVDDRHGWDFYNNNNTVYDGTSDDHGTHVAGTVGGRGGNNVALAGCNWIIKMIVCKFLGAGGGTTANAIRAIDYVTDLKIRHGLDVIATNNSWGGGGFSNALRDAITRAGNADILFCAAAGNDGTNNDSFPFYPASYSNANIISVASITSTGAKSGFSNYGATTVDMAAPGSNIKSTVPSAGGTASFAYYSGTSMATPHVTGAAALWASYRSERGLTLKTFLMNKAIATPSMSGRCVTNGRLNAGTN